MAEGLALWPALKGELLNLRRKLDLRTAHGSYEHWRESDHDDLVLAHRFSLLVGPAKEGHPARLAEAPRLLEHR